MTKLYRQIKLSDDEMDSYVFPHVLAMTGEKLHFKHEIAKELGVRDKRIADIGILLDKILSVEHEYGGSLHNSGEFFYKTPKSVFELAKQLKGSFK